MRVFTDKFMTIDYFSDEDYILVKRLGSDELDEKQYRYITNEWFHVIEKYKPSKQLVDYSELLRPIKPAIDISVKKAAFIIARDLYVQMSLEQTMSKATDSLEFRYFTEFNKAKEWLLQ